MLLVAAMGLLGAAVLAAQAPPAQAKAPKTTAPLPKLADPLDGGWPREVGTSVGTFTVYQPQLDSWDGSRLALYAAISLKAKEDAPPLYGGVWVDGLTVVNAESRLVTFSDREIRKVAFHSQPDKNLEVLEVLKKEVEPVTRSLALDRLAAMLEVADADKAIRSLELQHHPPRIVFSTTPAILAYVDGEPAWRPIKDTKLERVINTRVLLVRRGSDHHYLHVFDGWMKAKALEGPWEPELKPPKDLAAAETDAKASGQVDLLPGGNPSDPKTMPSLKQGRNPRIVIATAPTELIVTEGEPTYVPIEGTELQYVKNTTGNVFRHTSEQKVYLLVSGRWFRSATTEGPWEYVANDALPGDFAKIPDASEKENVKAGRPPR
jgi:hypothetical protein